MSDAAATDDLVINTAALENGKYPLTCVDIEDGTGSKQKIGFLTGYGGNMLRHFGTIYGWIGSCHLSLGVTKMTKNMFTHCNLT